jgi:hypothetical protein
MTWRLLFSGTNSLPWTCLIVLAAGTAIVLSCWLLRLERRMVSPTIGWTLLTLRCTVLTLLLVTLLQPVLTRQFDLRRQSRVVVAVDASDSMDTRDSHATLSEKLRWAQALGMLGNDETRPLIERWAAAADAGTEPPWLGSDLPPQTAADQAAANARRDQVFASLSEFDQMPRTEFACRLLTARPTQLLENLRKNLPVDLRLFATEQLQTTPQLLAQQLQAERSKLLPAATDALGLLQNTLTEESAGQIRSFVILSDGRQTAPADIAGTAQLLAMINVPVYAIPIGSALQPRDLAIASIDAPEAVFLKDKALVRTVLGTAGFEGEELTVRLESNGTIIQQQTITPATDSTVVAFTLPADQPGRFDYLITSDPRPGELRSDNNSRGFSLKVVDNKARVLLLDGDARWEFRYLNNLLERDRQVEATTVLFRQPWLEILNQPALPNTLPPAAAFREILARTDLLIIGDLNPAEADPQTWQMVEEAVTRDGLTVIIIPGRQYMPLAHQSDILSNMLPVTSVRQKLAEQFLASPPAGEQSAFRLTLTPAAQNLPMFQLQEQPGSRDMSLAELPGHPWIAIGTPKPGATVWATAAIPGLTAAGDPVIVQQDYGFGQVVWLGLDSTWRWRRRAGDEWHYKFWGQLIRWAARSKAAAGNSSLRMSVSDVVVDESESPEVVVRWDRRLLPQVLNADISVIAERPGSDTPPITLQLQPSPEMPERSTARLHGLTEGNWTLRLKVENTTVEVPPNLQTELIVRKQISAELADVSCNRTLLKQLAEQSGGELIEPWDVARISELLLPADQPQQKLQERSLWDHWTLIVLFCCLLMAEWVVRRVNGLP